MNVYRSSPTSAADNPGGQRMNPTKVARRSQTELAFTSSQAAGYLGVSLATVRRWSNAGHLHGYRTPGGQRRFSRDQLDQFLVSLNRGGVSDDVVSGV
jgi:excisionase family DNA binding protein